MVCTLSWWTLVRWPNIVCLSSYSCQPRKLHAHVSPLPADDGPIIVIRPSHICSGSHLTVILMLLHHLGRWSSIRDAPLDIWGGGGARVFVACKLFFYLWEKIIFLFWAINVRQFVAFPVRYHLVFFLGNIYFINFENKLFFSSHIFNKLFFLTFVATNFFFQFFSRIPTPQISNGASLKPISVLFIVVNLVTWSQTQLTLLLRSLIYSSTADYCHE